MKLIRTKKTWKYLSVYCCPIYERVVLCLVVSKLIPFVLRIEVVSRRRYVWSIGGMILIGETIRT